MKGSSRAILLAVGAALLYGLGMPVSKILVQEMHPVATAALLYLGAGAGMLVVRSVSRAFGKRSLEAPLARKDAPYVAAMILLDIAAPILLMEGLSRSYASTASLLNNFEIVATSLVALLVFKEQIGTRLWWAIGLITLASILLSVPNLGEVKFSLGAVLVMLACVCWGVENNCTRMISAKDPLMIVVIKGLGSGSGAAIAALGAGAFPVPPYPFIGALCVGFLSYGLSIYCYVAAQRQLGAARTSAYYAIAPFAGVVFSFLIFGDPITARFLAAMAIMGVGGYLAATEIHQHIHIHPGEIHDHRHDHLDGHHVHSHNGPVLGSHSHEHTHDVLEHAHGHLPDIHHRHLHDKPTTKGEH